MGTSTRGREPLRGKGAAPPRHGDEQGVIVSPTSLAVLHLIGIRLILIPALGHDVMVFPSQGLALVDVTAWLDRGDEVADEIIATAIAALTRA